MQMILRPTSSRRPAKSARRAFWLRSSAATADRTAQWQMEETRSAMDRARLGLVGTRHGHTRAKRSDTLVHETGICASSLARGQTRLGCRRDTKLESIRPAVLVPPLRRMPGASARMPCRVPRRVSVPSKTNSVTTTFALRSSKVARCDRPLLLPGEEILPYSLWGLDGTDSWPQCIIRAQDNI